MSLCWALERPYLLILKQLPKQDHGKQSKRRRRRRKKCWSSVYYDDEMQRSDDWDYEHVNNKCFCDVSVCVLSTRRVQRVVPVNIARCRLQDLRQRNHPRSVGCRAHNGRNLCSRDLATDWMSRTKVKRCSPHNREAGHSGSRPIHKSLTGGPRRRARPSRGSCCCPPRLLKRSGSNSVGKTRRLCTLGCPQSVHRTHSRPSHVPSIHRRSNHRSGPRHEECARPRAVLVDSNPTHGRILSGAMAVCCSSFGAGTLTASCRSTGRAGVEGS